MALGPKLLTHAFATHLRRRSSWSWNSIAAHSLQEVFQLKLVHHLSLRGIGASGLCMCQSLRLCLCLCLCLGLRMCLRLGLCLGLRLHLRLGLGLGMMLHQARVHGRRRALVLPLVLQAGRCGLLAKHCR